MKKILFVIASLKQGGGAEKVCSTIGTKLKKQGYDIHFLTFYDFPKEKLYPFEGKYFSLNEKLGGNIFSNFKKLFTRAKAIADYCKKNNIETVIGFMEEANFSVILSKYFGNKAKLNISIHQSIQRAYKGNKLYVFLIKILYSKADSIITVSNEEKDNLEKKYGFKNVITIYNPVDIEKIKKLSQENLGKYEKIFNNGKFTFINVGRLNNQKNQKQLIQVFKEFNKKYPQTQLVIIGEGKLRKELEKEIGENKNIYLLGLRRNPYKFLVNSDCFLFSSLWEGFGVVLVEALVCGLPVISSDCSTGPCEILRKNLDYKRVDSLEIVEYGILVSTGNKEELYKAIEKIYRNKIFYKKLKERSVEGPDRFDINSIISNWEKLFSLNYENIVTSK